MDASPERRTTFRMTDNFAEELAEMALALHDEPTLEETIDAVLEYVMKAVDCSHAGVIFVHAKAQVETVAATSPLVAELDRVQLEHGQGPDIDIITDPRSSVLVTDARTEERWPRWSEAVAAAGIRSMLGIRLHTTAATIGSLNLYDPRPHHFSQEDREVAHIFARHAAVALSSARDNANLWKAIDARKLIGQAQGILMERFDIDGDQAFAVLRRYSQDHNVKLHEVAKRLIATRTLSE
jgi:GAF domain-containing protein